MPRVGRSAGRAVIIAAPHVRGGHSLPCLPWHLSNFLRLSAGSAVSKAGPSAGGCPNSTPPNRRVIRRCRGRLSLVYLGKAFHPPPRAVLLPCGLLKCEAGATPPASTPRSLSVPAATRCVPGSRTQSRRRRRAGARPRPAERGCHCRAVPVLACRLGTLSRSLQNTARQTDRLAQTADHPPRPADCPKGTPSPRLFFIQPPVSLSTPPLSRPQWTGPRHQKPRDATTKRKGTLLCLTWRRRGVWGSAGGTGTYACTFTVIRRFRAGRRPPLPWPQAPRLLETRTKRGARRGAGRVGRP